ncbi:MORN repeat [Novymonas esmeraldas]|uniref:MORN repeat n=1 Tax=Novymonas esmeraldas TaxID=1808958 RepID=A0AAW0FE26_9TRYP
MLHEDRDGSAVGASADRGEHPSQPASPPSSVSARVVEARATTADAASEEPVLVGKVVSAEFSSAASPHHVPAGGAGRLDDTSATTAARGVVSQRAAATPTFFSSASSSSSSGADSDDESYDAAAFDRVEMIFDFGRYVGQVDPLTGLRDGEGCLHYQSGNVYTGSWRDGAAEGFGEKRYKNGDVYRGGWRQGRRSGRGAYLFAQGHFYDGMYADDAPSGYGIYSTLQGDRYAGQWLAGHKHGKGRETLVSGQVFIGNWRHGKKQGRGKLYLPGAEGFIYGIWNNDKFFRELTAAEMGVDGVEDVVDEFGVPRDATAPPVAPPWTRMPPAGAGMTDRVLMGVTALEDRMESLGRALERVMGGGESTQPPAARVNPVVGWTGPPAQGVLADDASDEAEDTETVPDRRPRVPPPPAAAPAPAPAPAAAAAAAAVPLPAPCNDDVATEVDGGAASVSQSH